MLPICRLPEQVQLPAEIRPCVYLMQGAPVHELLQIKTCSASLLSLALSVG